MSNAVGVESLGPPRDRRGRIRIDMGKLLTLRVEGYSLRQIGAALGVSDSTVRLRLRESTKQAPDPYYSMLGQKGQKARRRSMARRKREAKLEAERQKAAAARDELVKIGLLVLGAKALGLDREAMAPKRDDQGPGYGP